MCAGFTNCTPGYSDPMMSARNGRCVLESVTTSMPYPDIARFRTRRAAALHAAASLRNRPVSTILTSSDPSIRKNLGPRRAAALYPRIIRDSPAPRIPDAVPSMPILPVPDSRTASASGGLTPATSVPSSSRPSRMSSTRQGVFDAITTASGANRSRRPDTVLLTMRPSSALGFEPYGKLAVSA